MVRGDVINLAARLMHLEPGRPVCDAATVQAVRGRLTFEALEPVRLAGRAEPVTAFVRKPRSTDRATRQSGDSGVSVS